MNIKQFVTPELTVCRSKVITNKKNALETISELVSSADHRLDYAEILAALRKREQLGSTAIGHGVAIPHARIPNLKRTLCVAVTLESPINFNQESHDKTSQNVDLLICMLVPETATESHLAMLSKLSEKLSMQSYRLSLRNAKSNADLYQAFIEPF